MLNEFYKIRIFPSVRKVSYRIIYGHSTRDINTMEGGGIQKYDKEKTQKCRDKKNISNTFLRITRLMLLIRLMSLHSVSLCCGVWRGQKPLKVQSGSFIYDLWIVTRIGNCVRLSITKHVTSYKNNFSMNNSFQKRITAKLFYDL